MRVRAMVRVRVRVRVRTRVRTRVTLTLTLTQVYDAELRALGATDPGGDVPLPTEEAAHPYGTPAFMGLPARLCALQGERLRTDGVTMSCTEVVKERLEG